MSRHSVAEFSQQFLRDKEIIDSFDELVRSSGKKEAVFECRGSIEDELEDGSGEIPTPEEFASFSMMDIEQHRRRKWFLSGTPSCVEATFRELRELFPSLCGLPAIGVSSFDFSRDGDTWLITLTFKFK